MCSSDLSRTFLPAERNYNIYDCELLTVILALTEWRQYVQGTSHPITIITNHKNLSYIKDPCKLSRRQARWSLFLQDFDIVWKVLPGTKLAPADALSRYNQVNTSSDNANIAIVPEPMVISALDLTLARHIQSSSSTDPSSFVQSRTCLTTPLSSHVPHWLIGPSTMDIYIIRDACMFHLPLDPLYSTLSTPLPSLVTSAAFALKQLSNATFGGRDFRCLSTTLLPAVLFANRTRLVLTP